MKNVNSIVKSLIFNALFLSIGMPLICASPAELPVKCAVCNLDAPLNVQVIEIGTSWMTLNWDPVVNAAGYEVRAIDIATGLITSTNDLSIPQSSCTITDLIPGHTYKLSVACRCYENGSWSTSENVTYKSDYITLIIELVDIGFADFDPNKSFDACDQPIMHTNPAICTSLADSVPVYLGEIYRVDKWSRFEVKLVNVPNIVRVKPIKKSTYLENSFDNVSYFTDDLHDQTGIAYNFIRVVLNNLDSFKLSFSFQYSGVYNSFILVSKVATYNLPHYKYGFRERWPSKKVNSLSGDQIPETKSINTIKYINPVNDQIKIWFGSPLESDCRLMFFDINGHCLTNLNVDEGTENITVSTETWGKGIYFAQLIGENNLTTFKVIKE